MTDEEVEILEKAAAILSAEGFRGCYGTDEARPFWEAEKWIDRAIKSRRD